ncbi:Clp protease N-terminal domain-containing protein [Streptomyces sp. NPDC092296]|uniref:Clp protease N-terminal domain-containing protein n=1 Tax=Streptomyces sp. NPDC092296 TaxID=3366012 RepID=UPI00382EB12C
MFERFTDTARRTVVLAVDEARQHHHPRVDTDHLLAALLDQPTGPAAQALREHGVDPAELRRRTADAIGGALDAEALATLGIDLDQVREAAEASFGPGALANPAPRPGKLRHVPFSDRGKQVLATALREAMAHRHRHIGSGHLLIGLLRQDDGPAARLLTDAGIDRDRLRAEVLRLMSEQAAA